MAKAKGATTAAGLGWPHQQAVAELFRNHRDGSPCWWCAKPRYSTKELNWDGRQLAGDHSIPRAISRYSKADRLLHATCNEQRQDGSHDDQRPALTGVGVVATGSLLGTLAMPWP